MKFIKVFVFALIFAFFFVLPPISRSQNFSEDYHSLRPAPFSPYNQEVSGAILCGNTVYVSDSITKGSCCPVGVCCTCNYHENRSGNVTIDFTNSELPIVGNTEDVANWDVPTDTLTDAEKVNQYVSWYLNGTINRAEYPFLSWKDKEDIKKIINFSGPIRKLLPQRIQDDAREKQVADASTNIRHNQIVACTYGINIPIPLLNLQIGAIPGPCVNLGIFAPFVQKKRRVLDWQDNLPPKREGYDNYSDYYQAYRKWRGDTCWSVKIPLTEIELMLCFDNPLGPNFYGDLYPYIPFTSTEDRVGMAKKEVPTEINLGNLRLSNIVYDAKDLKLYYAHMQEDVELSDLLKTSFVPKQGTGGEGETTPVAIGTGCQILDIRTNPGDHLVNPGWSIDKKAITGDLSYTADFSCSFCGPKGSCTVKPVIPISLSTQNPLHDELWHNLVEGADSIFRRIFPKVGQGTSLDAPKDIPGTTTFEASSNRYTIATGGEIYFPHLGGISEYFLKGIQTMLRPKGYGETISLGNSSEQQSCNGQADLPNLPTGSGACKLTSTSIGGITLPPTMVSILEAAAQTYNVPPGLVLGVMFGEGTFNPGKYDWTEENVQTWSCASIPNCSGPSTSIVDLTGWSTLANQILPDLQRIDPNKSEADPCNLLDAVFALTKNLHGNAGGSSALTGKHCLNQTMTSTYPTSCTWNGSQYETSIRVWEFGTQWGNTSYGFLTCATKQNSCSTGGGVAAQCPTDTINNTDTCDNSSNANSHNACVWDVAHSH